MPDSGERPGLDDYPEEGPVSSAVQGAWNEAGAVYATWDRVTVAEQETARRDAYWKSVLRDLGARPVTCSTCAGSGTVNSAETEPCATCDGSGSEWVR